MGVPSFEAWYQSDAQAVYGLVVVPTAFLLWLALRGRGLAPGLDGDRAAFVRAYCLAFAIETIADAVLTGPGLRALGWADGPAGLAVVIAFVLLGDFRVLWLVLRFAGARDARSAAREAAVWTLVVPAFALGARAALEAASGPLPPQTIWLLYEVGFAGLALAFRERILPARAARETASVRAFGRAVATYALVYYALWALADVVIVVLGRDAGWALRMVPNQLYYALYVPFVCWRFFSPAYQDTSSSVQAVR